MTTGPSFDSSFFMWREKQKAIESLFHVEKQKEARASSSLSGFLFGLLSRWPVSLSIDMDDVAKRPHFSTAQINCFERHVVF